MTTVTVFGLMFLAGSGCSKEDKGAKVQAAMLQQEMATAAANQQKTFTNYQNCVKTAGTDATALNACNSITN